MKSCKNFAGTLAATRSGTTCKIIALNSGLEHYRRRLMELGFLPCQKVCVLQWSMAKKTVLVECGAVVFSLSQSLAQHILVEEI